MSGRSKKYDGQILRVKVFFQGQRIPVDQKENWFCHLPNHNPNRKISLIVEDSEKEININLANLFSVKFTTDSSGLLMPVTPFNQNSQQSLIPFIEPPPQSWEKIFSTSASSLLWEARFQVVQSYSNQINEIIGRRDNGDEGFNKALERKILFPIEIASNLQPKVRLLS